MQYVEAAKVLFHESPKDQWWTVRLGMEGVLAKLELKKTSLFSDTDDEPTTLH